MCKKGGDPASVAVPLVHRESVNYKLPKKEEKQMTCIKLCFTSGSCEGVKTGEPLQYHVRGYLNA